MTANIGLRLTLPSLEGGTIHVVIQPTAGTNYNISVTDVVGNPTGIQDLQAGLEYALVNVSALRQQLFEMLGGSLRRKPKNKRQLNTTYSSTPRGVHIFLDGMQLSHIP